MEAGVKWKLVPAGKLRRFLRAALSEHLTLRQQAARLLTTARPAQQAGWNRRFRDIDERVQAILWLWGYFLSEHPGDDLLTDDDIETLRSAEEASRAINWDSDTTR